MDDSLTQAANDVSAPDVEKLQQLQSVAMQNVGDLGDIQTIPQAANDEAPLHNQHQVYWYQNDHLGTPRELTIANGDIQWEAVYQAWGNTVSVEWQEVAQQLHPIQLNTQEQAYLLQPHRFQGQVYDQETGLHYNRFRYYDPDAGRFISHDPIGLLGGDNHFQYAPNPVGWVDPLGLKTIIAKIFQDVNKWSISAVSDRQKGMIKDKLSQVKERSSTLNQLMRDNFTDNWTKNIKPEWERQTGQTWPIGCNGKPATPHHVIPLKNGGTNEWWNIIPVNHPHTGTIHGKGSALRTYLPYQKVGGLIRNLLGKS